MKEAELRNHTVCSMCGSKVMASGLPLFWRVTVERFGIDMQAVTRQQGLSMAIGSAVLASVVGPGEDMASPIMEATTLTVCESCCTAVTCVAALAETGR